MTQGWVDALNAQTLPIEYYHSVIAAQRSEAETESFFRLFMAPGMSHCGGGPGPNVCDSVGPLMEWVERDAAPDRIVATKYVNDTPSQGVAMTRPLCLFPRVARYHGGNPASPSSFMCAAGRHERADD